ncbi:MAG TPA: glycosyltransferase family 4 protein [Blastocatellia bacterium]|nr:glycosyltransferase family 4 protein [Blastocatellia bacterium]
MNIGLIIYGDLETLTGGYLYDRKLVDYLRGQGDRVELISLPGRSYGRHLADNLSRSLFRRLREAKFDVLIQDELNHPSLFLLNLRLKNRARYPIVTLVHLLRCSESRPAWLNRLYGAVERRYLGAIDGAVFNSNTTRAAVKQLMGRDISGVVAYPGRDHLDYGAPMDGVAQEARRTGPLRVIFLANVLPGKGLNTLIDALGQMPRSSWRLMAVGSLTMDPSFSQAIRNQIARAGLSDNVELVGAVPNDEIPRYLVKNHVLVVPSRYEALGIAYLEAMGFGLPVIATSAGGAHEIISHGEVGFLTPPGDVNMLARYLRQINQDRDQLLKMSLAAYKRVGSHPTWDQSFARVRGFLQSLIGN